MVYLFTGWHLDMLLARRVKETVLDYAMLIWGILVGFIAMMHGMLGIASSHGNDHYVCPVVTISTSHIDITTGDGASATTAWGIK